MNAKESSAYTQENRVVTKKNKEGSHFVGKPGPSKEDSSFDDMYVNRGYIGNRSQYQQHNRKYEDHPNIKNTKMSRERNRIVFEDEQKYIPQTYTNRRYYYNWTNIWKLFYQTKLLLSIKIFMNIGLKFQQTKLSSTAFNAFVLKKKKAIIYTNNNIHNNLNTKF